MRPRHKDRTGQRFGTLTLLSFERKERQTYWKCRCDCGKLTTPRLSSHLSGSTKTCGYCPNPIGNRHPGWKGVGELSKHLWNTYKHSAIDRDLTFNVSMEYLWELFLKQDRRCAFTGWDICFPKSYEENHTKTASLDRIDSNLGYEPGNVQWVHRDLNRLKVNMDNARFIEICSAVDEFNKRRIYV